MGYHRAGFEVVGVDINPQPHYPFEFHQADALTYPLEGFDAIHASPPCQAYSRMRHLSWLKDREYWDSIPPTRELLAKATVPWVMENVKGSPLDGVFLCGQMFDLNWPDGRPIYRHRVFESTVFMLAPGHPKHYRASTPGSMLGARQTRMSGIGRLVVNGRTRVNGEAVGIDWMTSAELSQAIPPAYTEWIGQQLMRALAEAA
jgi:DNA (cytosine-5)-methyltransferase 1